MSAWSNARDVLAIRLDQIGDVLMTTPALATLRDAVPGRRITLLTSSAGATIAPLLPDIDDVIVYDPPWMKATSARTDPAPDLAMIERLGRGAFDAAVIFTVYTQSAAPAATLAYLAGIPLRAAYRRDKLYGLLTDSPADRDLEAGAPLRHEVTRQLELVAELGAPTPQSQGMRLDVPPESLADIRALLATRGIRSGDRRWAVIHPGASAESRRYPPESFAAAATMLSRELGWQIVLAGGSGDSG